MDVLQSLRSRSETGAARTPWKDDDRLRTAEAALRRNPSYAGMSDDLHLSISVSESFDCVHLINVMTQLGTKLKSNTFLSQ